MAAWSSCRDGGLERANLDSGLDGVAVRERNGGPLEEEACAVLTEEGGRG